VTITDDTTGSPLPAGRPRLSDHFQNGTAGTGTFGNLLVTELKRVRARRITRVLLLGLVGVLVIVWIGYAWGSRPLSAAEQQQSQSYFDEATTDFQRYCNDDGTVKTGVDENFSPWGDCSYPPEPDQYGYTRSSHFSDLPGASLAFAGLAAAVMLLLAASMVGADLNSGNLGTQLLFVPQRGRIFVARAVATALVAIVVAVATIGLGSVGMWLVMRHLAATDADTHGNTRLWWATSARGILVVLAVALTAYAITWIVGHTAATIGLAGAWLIIVEQFVSGTDQLVALKPFAPAMNLIAIAQGHGSYSSSVCTTTVGQGRSCEYVEKTYSLAHALTLWSVILAVLLGAAMWWFHRKDVT
jgi:ABC-2 type transport system permease protein